MNLNSFEVTREDHQTLNLFCRSCGHDMDDWPCLPHDPHLAVSLAKLIVMAAEHWATCLGLDENRKPYIE